MSRGWHGESYRHSLASRGIETRNRNNIQNKFTIDRRTKYLDNTRNLSEEMIFLKNENGDMIGHGALIIDHRNKTIYVAGIRTYELGRGKGFSKLLMKEMIRIIDNFGYESELVVMPDEDSSLNEKEIERFCKGFGFKTIDDQLLMKRPSTKEGYLIE